MGRLGLQTTLEGILESRNVYFQPPESVKLVYPCIVYSRSSILTNFGDNIAYYHLTRYTVTLMDKNPDSTTNARLLAMPTCKFERHFVKDNLNHDVYNVYY